MRLFRPKEASKAWAIRGMSPMTAQGCAGLPLPHQVSAVGLHPGEFAAISTRGVGYLSAVWWYRLQRGVAVPGWGRKCK